MSRALALTVAAIALGGLVSPGLAAAHAAPRPDIGSSTLVLSGTVPTLVHDATRLGELPPTKQLHLVLPLAITDQSAMDAAVAAEYQPGSSNFHHFLSPSQFGAEFGAPQGDVDLVTAALRQAGFTVPTATPGHLYVDAIGTVAQAEHTFDVSIDRFRLSTGQTFYANATDITMPASMNGLASGVIGLQSLDAPKSNLEYPTKAALAAERANPAATQAGPVAVDGGASPCPAADAGGGYVAPQLATAYNFNGLYAKGYLGQGMHAALVEFDDYHDSNVAEVKSCYDVSTKVQRQVVDGGTGGQPAEGEGEDMADISTLLELLPKLKQLDVYVAPITFAGEADLYGKFAAQDKDPVLSSSWGNCEELNSQADNLLFERITAESAAQGQNILDAAGDSGAIDCGGYPSPTGESISVEEESAVPWVTGVGGTDLGENTANGVSPSRDEDTWNDAGAGGGGVSTLYAMPPWQHALKAARTAPGHSGSVCGAAKGQLCREIPDISADADPLLGEQTPTKLQFTDDIGSPGYSIYCGTANCSLAGIVTGGTGPSQPPAGAGGWEPVGGTSLATPLSAAAVVLWDQEAKTKGLDGVGLIDPSLYRIAASKKKYAKDFNDITTDSNDDQYDTSDCPSGCNPKRLYRATKGYDMASGLGSINAANLGSDVVKASGHIEVAPSTIHVYGYTHGVSTTSPIVVSDGYRHASYKAHGNAKWLHLKKGRATGALRWHASPKHLKPGTRTGTITLRSHGQAQRVTVIYQVTKKARIGLSSKHLTFKERIVNTSDQTTANSCNNNLYNDEFFDLANDSSGTKVDASTKKTLTISNQGPKGSVLHWTALPYSQTSSWLSTDLASGKIATGPKHPIVSTEGADKHGKSTGLPLVSVGNGNAVGGYPKMNQGTYHGKVIITDLADPRIHKVVKATMILGNGKGTPTVAAKDKSYSVSVAKAKSTSLTVTLVDPSKTCGYQYSLSSNKPYAVPNADDYSGMLPATGAVAASGDDTGDGQGTIQVAISAQHLTAGKHTVKLTVQSQNAEPNPLKIPIHVTVTK